jgi:hypothetical protein
VQKSIISQYLEARLFLSLQCHLSKSFIVWKILLAYYSASAALIAPIHPYADTPIRSSSLVAAPLRYVFASWREIFPILASWRILSGIGRACRKAHLKTVPPGSGPDLMFRNFRFVRLSERRMQLPLSTPGWRRGDRIMLLGNGVLPK